MAKGGKRPNAGRKKGLSNKIATDYKEAAIKKYPTFNPIVELLELYYQVTDPKLKLDALKELAKKYVPDLKAVEVTNLGTQQLEIVIKRK